MAANNITIEATGANGQTLEALSRLIAERERLIKGETTQNAVVATAINILKSVRAKTKVADPKKIKVDSLVQERPDLEAGFYNENGLRIGRRAVRIPGGHHITSVKISNLMGRYTKGECAKVFIALASGKAVDAKEQRRYIIARTKKEAADFWAWFIKRRIEAYAGMARWAVGQAMRQLSIQGNARMEADDVIPKSKAKSVALANLSVLAAGDGFGSGYYGVTVNDGLNYALAAIKGGAGEFDNILKRTANKTASIINHWVNHSYRSKVWNPGIIESPFPEVKQRR